VLVDPADLLDAHEVAHLLGLARREAVSTYRRRYRDFPEPTIEKSRCVLWLRADVEAWARGRGRDTAVTRDGEEHG
jgi:predicted DNA-binding transcriptional regulator AlpA